MEIFYKVSKSEYNRGRIEFIRKVLPIRMLFAMLPATIGVFILDLISNPGYSGYILIYILIFLIALLRSLFVRLKRFNRSTHTDTEATLYIENDNLLYRSNERKRDYKIADFSLFDTKGFIFLINKYREYFMIPRSYFLNNEEVSELRKLIGNFKHHKIIITILILINLIVFGYKIWTLNIKSGAEIENQVWILNSNGNSHNEDIIKDSVCVEFKKRLRFNSPSPFVYDSLVFQASYWDSINSLPIELKYRFEPFGRIRIISSKYTNEKKARRIIESNNFGLYKINFTNDTLFLIRGKVELKFLPINAPVHNNGYSK